jgi:hypothetical protein
MSWLFWVAAALGGIIGGAVGFLAVRNIGATSQALAARTGVFFFFSVGSAIALPYILHGLFGGIFPEPPIEDEIAARLRDVPMLERVFQDFPDSERDLKVRAARAYREGGEAALVQELERASQEIGVFARYHYLPRAQDEDLLRFTTRMVAVLKELAKKDPVLCVLWMQPEAGGEYVMLSDITKVIGEVPVAEYESAAAEAIVRASVAIPDYDKSRADAVNATVGLDVVDRFSLRVIEMLSGRQEIKTADDARKVCLAAAQMYERITQYRREDAVAALRDFMRGMAEKQKPKPSNS